MSEQRVSSALQFFFASYLTAAQRNTLQQQTNGVVELRRGAYRAYSGEPIETSAGINIQPEFSIEVSQNTIPLQNGAPSVNNIAMGDTVNREYLIWMRDLADIIKDSKEEIERIMHNINYYVNDDNARNASAWAQAIVDYPNRSELNRNIFEYTEVPQEFINLTNHLSEFRQTLLHFFTFTNDGEYFTRWTGDGRSTPNDLSDIFKQRSLTEFQLEEYDVYMYAVVPTSFLQSNTRESTEPFREIVWGFQWGGDDGNTPTNARVLHTVAKTQENAGDYFDFVCCEAEDGLGVSMPVSARATIHEGLADFLQNLPDEEDAENRNVYLRHSDTTTNNDNPMVKVFATVDEEISLPDGVESIGSGPVRALYVPPDQVINVAENEHVQQMRAPRILQPRLSNVRPDVKYSAMDAAIAAADATKQGGAGVIVGIIDGGIDGSHPSFTGRIHSFWNQNDSTGPTPASSMTSSGFLNFIENTILYDHGTELTGANVSNARDAGGHGTHVAGIAAGAAVTTSDPVPAGMAPNANLIAVTTGQPTEEFTGLLNDFDVYRAIRYIFYKAEQISQTTPAVVNMSIGTHDHAHDKTDALSLALDYMLKDDNDNYMPGKILVASAGNERNGDVHLHKNVASGASETFSFGFTGFGNTREAISIWVTNSVATNTTLNATIETKRPSPSVTTTGNRTQQATSSPVWNHFYGQNVHVGTVFGPPDPLNNDFNIRILFVSSVGLVPDPAGTITIGANKYTQIRLDENGNRLSDGVNIKNIANGIHVPLTNGFINRQWDIVFTNNETASQEFHVWAGNECAHFINTLPSDNNTLILTPAESDGVISVASCNTGTGASAGSISVFSSPGPLRKRPTEPGIDITAPGSPVVSSRSHQAAARTGDVNANATSKQGTSMSSPAIAGLVANVLAEEPTLTLAQLKTRLARCSIPTKMRNGTTTLVGPSTANDWGKGLVEAIKLRR